jgi:hypothetical protein
MTEADPSSMRDKRAVRALASLSAWQVAATLVTLGLGLLYVSSALQEPQGASALEETIQEAGALLLVTGAITLLWELRGRRALTDEVLTAANLSSDVTAAGLRRVTTRYLPDVEWEDLFRGAAHVDLLFAYATTWRNTHASSLRAFVGRDSTRLRAVLPDLNDAELVSLLARKFRYSGDTLRQYIIEAKADFENLAQQATALAIVEVRYTTEFPVYSYYRFDRKSVAVLYAPTPGRAEVPTIVCEQDGSFAAFFRAQYEDLWNDARPAAPPQ